MRLSIGQKIQHKKHGKGTVTAAWYGAKSSENYAVKFDKGGPVGFAQKSTNDADALKAIN